MADYEKRLCSVCYDPCDFSCSRCRQPYCSLQCQQFHWTIHKRICFPMPRLIKLSNVMTDPSHNLETEMNVCLAMERPIQLVPIQIPKTIATIETDKVTTANDVEFRNQLGRNPNYPDYQKEDHGETSKGAAPIETLFNDGRVDSNTSKVDQLKPDGDTPISTDYQEEQVSTKLSTMNEIWMIPFPIEENVFVPVVVQFATGYQQYAWVILEKNEIACNKLLHVINYEIIPNAPNVQDNEIKVGQLYLVQYEDIYYRGVSLKVSTASVLIRLIDYGNEITVPNDRLKEAPLATKNLNAFAFQIKFQTPRQVAVGDNLNIQIKSISDGNVLNVFVEAENNFATKDDLEFIPIPVGVKTNLYCLDFSNIEKGYVSACVNDTTAIRNIEQINEKISAYCKCSEDGYHPHVNELCLVKYQDGEWYRGSTLKVTDSDTFSIMFIDYGNITQLNSLDIRKMPEEFMHHCLMNVCFIEGVAEEPTDDYIEKTSTYFSEHQVFPIESAEKEKDVYLIDVPQLQW